MAKRKSTDIVNLKFRMTEAMRARLEQEAKRNHRSLNGEMLHRIAQSFGAEGLAMAQEYDAAQKHLAKMLDWAVEQVMKQNRQ